MQKGIRSNVKHTFYISHFCQFDVNLPFKLGFCFWNVWHTIAFDIYFSCIFPFQYFSIFLLVVEHYIWKPNPLAGHIQSLHSPVFNRVPFQLVVIPCLEKHRIRKGGLEIQIILRPPKYGHFKMWNSIFRRYLLFVSSPGQPRRWSSLLGLWGSKNKSDIKESLNN